MLLLWYTKVNLISMLSVDFKLKWALLNCHSSWNTSNTNIPYLHRVLKENKAENRNEKKTQSTFQGLLSYCKRNFLFFYILSLKKQGTQGTLHRVMFLYVYSILVLEMLSFCWIFLDCIVYLSVADTLLCNSLPICVKNIW